MSFTKELKMRIEEKPFNVIEARNLSERLIHLEIDGYKVSPREDALWGELTARIESTTDSPRKPQGFG